MAAHSRSKNGVASLAYVAAIPINKAPACKIDQDTGRKPGMTAYNIGADFAIPVMCYSGRDVGKPAPVRA
jgi:hypothetical protein